MIRVPMTSELSQQRNDAITYFTSAIILDIGNLSKSFTGAFFSNTVASMFVKFKQNVEERYQDIFGLSFHRNKYGKKRSILMFGRYL